MDRAAQLLLLLGALLVALRMGARVAAWWRRRKATRAGRAYNRRGQKGERAAERLLRRHGYAPYGRQVRTQYSVQMEGECVDVQLQADYLVERDGQRLVAEVKTGKHAPRFQHAETRRQLLEYQLAFGVDSVLLVDVEAGEVREVRFPLSREARAGSSLRFWLLAIAVFSAVAIELIWRVRVR